jgi:hypothetical protein
MRTACDTTYEESLDCFFWNYLNAWFYFEILWKLCCRNQSYRVWWAIETLTLITFDPIKFWEWIIAQISTWLSVFYRKYWRGNITPYSTSIRTRILNFKLILPSCISLLTINFIFSSNKIVRSSHYPYVSLRDCLLQFYWLIQIKNFEYSKIIR